MAPSSGRGRGRGGRGGRGSHGEDGEASPEWLPPRQRRELEASRAARSPTAGGSSQNPVPPTPPRALRSRIPVRQQGQSQEFLNQPGIRAAAGLGEQAAPNGGGDAAAEVRGRIATVFRRQEGNVWALGRPRDQEPAHQDEVDIEGVRVALVGEEVEAEVQGGDQPGTQPTQPPPPLPQGENLPDLEELQNTLVPTLKWCPKAARGDFARELASLWQRLVENPGEVRLWILESMFVRVILPAGRGPRAGDAYSQARLVRERLRRWRGGEYGQLWDEAKELTKEQRKKPKNKRGEELGEEEKQRERNAERAKTLAQDGQYTKALQALMSAGMAPPTRANIEIMKEKHPQATRPQPPAPQVASPQLSFTSTEVEKMVKKFRRRSAPGPSGLRPEHLKVSLQAAPGRRQRALQSLTSLVNCMTAGGVPEQVAPYLCGARLHGALKKDGGVRPIAVGNLLRRLVGKCCATRVQEKAAALLSPHQVGVGVRNGCEAIVHTVRKALAADPSLWVLQCDFINAFNQADRQTALEEVARSFPEILAWVNTCYGKASNLLFGDTLISSQCGFHQGDPLAALLFSLVLQSLVMMIQERVPRLAVNTWFLDDGTLVGELDDLQEVVDILVQQGPAKGLILSTSANTVAPNRPKSSVWSPQDLGAVEEPLQQVPRVVEEGIILLGAPLGSAAFVRQAIQAKVSKVEAISARLPLLKDPHTEFVLLRSCLALPKISFILRTVDTSNHIDLLQDFDANTRESLTRILGCPLDERAWRQAKLPVGMGGLGLRGAKNHATAAHAASVLSSLHLVASLLRRPVDQLFPALSPQLLALLSVAQGEEALEENLNGVSQKQISYKVDNHQQQLLLQQLQEGEVRERARLASVSLPHAGDWLVVAPLAALGLHLRPAEFVLVVKYRLGLAVFDQAGPCPACLRPSDVLGDHAMCCGTGGERIARHNHLRDAVFDTAAAAGLGPVKEGRFLLPGCDRRPADVLLPNWAQGRDAALDVTVVTPLQQETLAQAATTPGHALTFAYERKIRGAEEACRRQGIAFIPLAAESFGGWHGAGEREVRKLGAALARHTGQDESEAVHHLWGLGVYDISMKN